MTTMTTPQGMLSKGEDGLLNIDFDAIPAELLDIMNRNDAESPLLKLPSEIRNKIYRYVLTGKVISVTIQERSKIPPTSVPSDGFGAAAASQQDGFSAPVVYSMKVHNLDESVQMLDPLWLVSRRMYLETRQMVFSPLNTFLLFDVEPSQRRPWRAFAMSKAQVNGVQNVIPGNRTALPKFLTTATLPNISTVYVRSSINWFAQYKDKADSIHEADPAHARRFRRTIEQTLYDSDYSWAEWPLSLLCQRWKLQLVRSEEPPRIVMKYPRERNLQVDTPGEVCNIITKFMKYRNVAKFGNVPSRIVYRELQDDLPVTAQHLLDKNLQEVQVA